MYHSLEVANSEGEVRQSLDLGGEDDSSRLNSEIDMYFGETAFIRTVLGFVQGRSGHNWRYI